MDFKDLLQINYVLPHSLIAFHNYYMTQHFEFFYHFMTKEMNEKCMKSTDPKLVLLPVWSAIVDQMVLYPSKEISYNFLPLKIFKTDN